MSEKDDDFFLTFMRFLGSVSWWLFLCGINTYIGLHLLRWLGVQP